MNGNHACEAAILDSCVGQTVNRNISMKMKMQHLYKMTDMAHDEAMPILR